MHKQSRLLLTISLLSLFTCSQALAWGHAGSWGGRSVSAGGGSWSANNYRGGNASGGDGSWSAENSRGGSASGGNGSWNAESARGGSASGGDGSWNANSAQGGSASGEYGRWTATGRNGNTAYGTNYYHPPTTVNRYSAGCYECGYNDHISTAGAVVAGAAVGAAVANNNAYYSNGNAYAAGYQDGQDSTTYQPNGVTTTSLPPGCSMNASEAGTYYQCGNTWYKPSYGANGVYYTMVPAPQ